MSRWTQADVDRMYASANSVRDENRKLLANLEKPSKFGNCKTNGYASKREAKRAAELKLLEKAGKINSLREQTPWELIPKQDGERACKYISDFDYFDVDAAELVVEDVKGYRDPIYRIKRKLMKFVHGITVREV